MGFLRDLGVVLGVLTQEPQQSAYMPGEFDNMQPVRTVSFDGEKTPDELGAVLNVLPNYNSLRLRSHEANLKSDVVKIITNKYFKWIIGTGLKLQSEPVLEVLNAENINKTDLSNFKDSVEAYFNLWAKSKRVDYKGENHLHGHANDLLKTAFLGGDCLVISRIEDGDLNVQLVDGQHVQTPDFTSPFHKDAKEKGHTINHGIEKDGRGRHVAFYIRIESEKSFLGEYKRIPAYGENSKRKLAWMYYSDKHRIDHDRGIGKLAPILEKIEKLDRFTEAAVGSAEERAKIPFFFTHDRDSDGSNPLAGQMRKAMGQKVDQADGYAQGETKARNIRETTGKQVYNMPVGADIKTPSVGSVQMEYPEFWKAIFNSIAAAADIPPEVALQMYNSNYSASRAAINGWQHLMNVERERLVEGFYKPIFDLWLELHILKGKISAPGYLKASQKKNMLALEAYSFCRFTGSNMPHIDPKKEVDAIRGMLGTDLAHVPLINLEQGTEKLNSGDWNENYKKFLKEKVSIPEKVEQNGPTQNKSRE